MELTEDVKARIDEMDYFQLLERWRYAPVGDPVFQGTSGNYWWERMQHLRSQPGGHERAVSASKLLG